MDKEDKVCVYIYIYAYVYTYVYVYIYICVCVCVYIYIYIHTHCIFFIYSPMNGHLGCFHVLTTVNNAAMNIVMYVSF